MNDIIGKMAWAAGDALYGDGNPIDCPNNYARAKEAITEALKCAEANGWVLMRKPLPQHQEVKP